MNRASWVKFYSTFKERIVTKLKVIALAMGLSVAVCAARASRIDFSGVVSSAVGSGIFSPPPISVGDTFSGFVIFDYSNTVLAAGVVFPRSELSTQVSSEFFQGSFMPISNGYSFDSGQIFGGLDGTDSLFAFNFHDTVNSFFAQSNALLVDLQDYEGQISHFSVSIPERGGTMLFLTMSLMPLIAARIKRSVRVP